MARKLFGNSGRRSNRDSQSENPKPRKKKSALKRLSVFLALILIVEALYCVAIFTNLQPFATLRNMWIATAMSTMHHQWLAKSLIPGDIVMEYIRVYEENLNAQTGVNSSWGSVDAEKEATAETTVPVETRSPSVGFSTDQAAAILGQLAQDTGMTGSAAEFFDLFHELDRDSTYAYVENHPEVIADGWENFYVNEAGLDDEGTEIYTAAGDQVLAINAEYGMMAIRVTGDTYRGVLLIAKDPSRLKLAPSSALGSSGQHVGVIAERHDALAGMTGSGFVDGANGVSEGGLLAGAAMHSGDSRGYHYPAGYKRVELHRDNRLYITDANTGFSDDCTDACEWTPALIVDGKIVVTAADNYMEMNPRACIGQTRDESIMFLVIEGRLVGTSLGTDTIECAEIMARYDCYQAMNVDGGSSAILWYEDEYITRCSNTSASEGRFLPNAWVYCREPVPDPE